MLDMIDKKLEKMGVDKFNIKYVKCNNVKQFIKYTNEDSYVVDGVRINRYRLSPVCLCGSYNKSLMMEEQVELNDTKMHTEHTIELVYKKVE